MAIRQKGLQVLLFFISAFLTLPIISIASAMHLARPTPTPTPPPLLNGATVDMSQILPESHMYVKNRRGEDLIDIGKKLGMNTFRITNITSSKKDGASPSYTHNQWAMVLNKMQQKGMRAVILVEANAVDTQWHNNALRLDDYYLTFVRNYIVNSGVCTFPNVLAIDIRNEPVIDAHNLTKLREASQLIKAACPNAKITIGSWRIDNGSRTQNGEIDWGWHDPRVVTQLNDIVDIHSVHIYGFDKMKDGKYPDPYAITTGYLREIRKYTAEPILIEEFGAGNGSGLTDQNTVGSERLQKKAYEGVLKAAYDMRNSTVIGAIAYLFYPRSHQPEAWNIAKDNANTLLPATQAFKKYSVR
jgi:hypothetical protein